MTILLQYYLFYTIWPLCGEQYVKHIVTKNAKASDKVDTLLVNCLLGNGDTLERLTAFIVLIFGNVIDI